MKLYYTPRSPYARKVLLAAYEKGLEKRIECIEVPLPEKPQELLAANPLGKVPCLVLPDGTAIYDSPVIVEYLDTLSDQAKLIPMDKAKRVEARRIEALADGIADAAVAIVMEGKRPLPQQWQDMVDQQRDTVDRGITALARELPVLKEGVSLSSIAASAALGYVRFRLPDLGWEKKHPALAEWFAETEHRPAMQATYPVAA